MIEKDIINNLNTESLVALFNYIDADSNGTIDFDEFCKYLGGPSIRDAPPSKLILSPSKL